MHGTTSETDTNVLRRSKNFSSVKEKQSSTFPKKRPLMYRFRETESTTTSGISFDLGSSSLWELMVRGFCTVNAAYKTCNCRMTGDTESKSKSSSDIVRVEKYQHRDTFVTRHPSRVTKLVFATPGFIGCCLC
jgi:hypothetical protein